jgi:uncharacterized protein YbjQ (UPF0145 family)
MSVQRPPISLKESLAHVAKGGIPLRAKERLAEEKGAHARLFTSALSVREFLLLNEAECKPIAQVMGSSVFHVGQISDYKGKTEEVTVISDAHRKSRQMALARLQQEAALVDADAVVGVRISDRMITMGQRGKGGDDGGEVLEFTVIGTAVHAPWIKHPPGKPVLTDLSGQDLWVLHQDGFQPCGFLFDFCRFHAWHVMNPDGLDAEFQSRLAREGGASGEIRISLLWNNTNDLDLHVIPPSGEEISFSHKKSQCGGVLDVDMNVSGRSTTPIENVFWAHGGAPQGRYEVRIKQYTCRTERNTPWRLEIVAGGIVTHIDGAIDGEVTNSVHNFKYGGVVPMEIPLAKHAIEQARGITASKLLAQANAAGADYVIGSDLDVKIREVPCGFAGCELNDLDVEVSWFGTGVKRIGGPEGREKDLPPLILSMMPLNRSRRLGDRRAEDEPSDDIEFAAEEAEELAAETDELNAFAAEVAAEAAGGD